MLEQIKVVVSKIQHFPCVLYNWAYNTWANTLSCITHYIIATHVTTCNWPNMLRVPTTDLHSQYLFTFDAINLRYKILQFCIGDMKLSTCTHVPYLQRAQSTCNMNIFILCYFILQSFTSFLLHYIHLITLVISYLTVLFNNTRYKDWQYLTLN